MTGPRFVPLLLALLCPSLAFAQVRTLPAEPRHDVERSGTGGTLPVGCRYTEDELEQWAPRIGLVQEAMTRFAARGYQRIAVADTAVNGCMAFGQNFSMVLLAYRKPGAFIDSSHVVWPEIVVMTRANENDELSTTVTAGLVVTDGATATMFPADSLPQFASDRSFDVEPHRGGGRQRIGVEWMEPPGFDRSKFEKYLRCVGWGTVGCVIRVAKAPGGVNLAKLAILIDQPELGLGLLASCMAYSSFICLSAL